MSEQSHTPSAHGTALAEVPESRSCTRCDGEPRLAAGSEGFGKYVCDHCGMVVGFDLESHPPEFLIDRGAAGRYSKELFGSRLTGGEYRLR